MYFCGENVLNFANMMNKKLFLIVVLALVSVTLNAQISPETLAKREKRKNLTVKEWNTDSKAKVRWLDHVTVYDSEGRKIEEIEYATYGQRERVTYEYDDTTGKVIKEVVYNDRNNVERIRKYEWNENGTKAKQYNYLPNGKLYSVKVFEYIFND